MCYLGSAVFQPQRLIRLQFRDQLYIRISYSHQIHIPGFRPQVCRLVKLRFRMAGSR